MAAQSYDEVVVVTFSEDDPRPVLQVRDKELHGRVSEFADQHGMTLSDVLRRAVREFLPDDEHINAPTDPKLREAYLWLRERADDRDRVQSSEVISDLAQKFSLKENYIKSSLLGPLEREGWIDPNFHYIRVLEHASK